MRYLKTQFKGDVEESGVAGSVLRSGEPKGVLSQFEQVRRAVDVPLSRLQHRPQTTDIPCKSHSIQTYNTLEHWMDESLHHWMNGSLDQWMDGLPLAALSMVEARAPCWASICPKVNHRGYRLRTKELTFPLTGSSISS